ncbi:hypothetical protein [Beijerinckia sp. L45]|uniref:hypothetical protein n=1 Tax=Beijerinckia sp. L45 TaxID=1641855 RepID=UPI00131D357A|nr:hypothetical protein [Beijerinckia sp. L45]
MDGLFGLPKPEPQSMLLALVADSAAMRQSAANTDRRLESIFSEVQKLVEAVMVVQSQSARNAADIQEMKARCETIDKSVDEIATLKLRTEALERDLIKNGELRMSNLERLRTAVAGVFCTILVSGTGYLIATFVMPLLKH